LTKNTEKALDEIFGGPPAAFIKGRDALAKQLSDDGDPEEAKRVKALRKPSKAASALNALALDDPKPVRRYLGLADKLRKATSGKVDAKRMRELAREEGELLEELVARAGKAGDSASASTLDRVRETLQAAQVDAELADKVLAGRVEREERAASVGLENLAGPPVAPSRKKASAKESASDESSKQEAAAKKRRGEAKAELQAAQAEAREAAREVARAERALAKAERAREAADGRVERAEAKLEKLG
jgi:hypothetical protein